MTYNNDLYYQIKPYLNQDETLLWTGKPAGNAPIQNAPFLVIFMIFWFGFAVFWTVSATAAGGFFGIFGIFFIAFGAFGFYNAIFGQNRVLKNAVYAVTDRRAIILTNGRNGINCAEYIFANLPHISLESVNGTRGTIRFVQNTMQYDYYGGRRYHHNHSTAWHTQTAFIMIEDVHSVYRLISEQIGR
ncbi:MAG: hypothetical protein IJ489_08365 [Clostridia bacterium]|nr:hypothetical protein [Clostridia bacterium]